MIDAETRLARLESALIRESRYSDCHPDRRWQLTLPTGGYSWHPTRDEAVAALWRIVEGGGS